jgi:hypothetical protein
VAKLPEAVPSAAIAGKYVISILPSPYVYCDL